MRSKMFVLGVFLMFFSMKGLAYCEVSDSLTLEPLNEESIVAPSVLESEAGISAYAQVSNVDLDKAETAFQNVEVKTEDYIIGTVIPDAWGWETHMYIDTAGWIVSYHLKEIRASEIFSFGYYEIYGRAGLERTMILESLEKVATAMEVEVSSVRYYDFRYPDATNMMIIVDKEASIGATETFRIMLSGTSLEMYSMTWLHAIHETHDGYGGASVLGNIKIDDEIISNQSTFSGWRHWYGDITSEQLSPDIYHTISLYNTANHSFVYGISYVGIVLIYKL